MYFFGAASGQRSPASSKDDNVEWPVKRMRYDDHVEEVNELRKDKDFDEWWWIDKESKLNCSFG